jgi:hypothetical protein
MEDAGPPDGKARIHLSGDFSALEIEDILAEIAKVRASLEPQVSTQPPSLLSDAEVLVQEDALFHIRRRIGGGLRIWLRNEGFGWLAFELNDTAAAELKTFLSSELRAPGQPH